jgi:putative Mn2+ efflux pump MntP
MVALTLPLCIDSFFIATAIGVRRPPHRQRLRLSLLFAAFEGGMPLIGLVIGRSLSGAISGVAEYVAAAILIGFGIYTLLHIDEEDDEAQQLGQTHGFALLALGLGISLDGLAIGFTYGLLKIPVIPATILIVVQAFAASQIGFAVGSKVPERFREWGERAASIALIAIGVVILFQQLH